MRATLESIGANTALPYELLLLGDGPDEPTAELISSWPGARKSIWPNPRGMAACLNRLVAETAAGIVVLVEAGSVCGHRWLDLMADALLASPRHGLAGPSTNLCWNEQRVCSGEGDVRARAAKAAAHFGAEVRTLEPLYSLADFCYMVRRETVQDIGAADEEYGLGPCWEMDYNIRAARAGWSGIWVCGAYVQRWPMAARRAQAEQQLFERNKRRYQSKFCRRQLRGGQAPFRSHCRGDACPNFAAPDGAEPRVSVSGDLITCIMPTRNRPEWVRRGIDSFLAQDYPHRELLILDDSEQPLRDIPADPRIRYEHLPPWRTIGAKRNLACERARGEWVAHQDDDDWYPPDRLSRQMEAMQSGDFDICGSSRLYYLDREPRRAFCYEWAGGPKPWVAGPTLMYRKSFWKRHPFRDLQVGEDAWFIWGAEPRRVLDQRDPALCVASLHRSNTGAKDTSNSYWKPADFEMVLGLTRLPDRPFSEWPLISCIMPTADRRAFLSLALRRLAMQHAVRWELVVVDDGAHPVEDLAAGLEHVRYLRVKRGHTIGEKRNFACEHARGEIIAHWDDDDWYGRGRLQAQVLPLLRGDAEITGLVNTHLLTLPDGEFWSPTEDLHQRMYTGNVAGGTLVFWKRIWDEGARYPAASLAEDAMFLRTAVARGNRLGRISGDALFVYMRHNRNSWRFRPGTFLDPAGWKRVPAPADFSGDDMEEYCAAARAPSGE